MTHSVANTLKRIVIIVVSTIVFGAPRFPLGAYRIFLCPPSPETLPDSLMSVVPL